VSFFVNVFVLAFKTKKILRVGHRNVKRKRDIKRALKLMWFVLSFDGHLYDITSPQVVYEFAPTLGTDCAENNIF
jgi:hypothetical protein